MKVVYSDQKAPSEVVENSIFLAGPTPRDEETPSWRPEALKILKKIKYSGTVFVPEMKVKKKAYDYDTQVEWEWNCLHSSDVIVFWVPRELEKMPGFTTNVEFGFYLAEGDSLVLYGRPEWAAKKGYLDWLYKKVCDDSEIFTSLEDMLKYAKWACEDQDK